MTTQNFTLTGYEIVDRIYSGTRTLVYRALRLWDKQPVAIKVLHSQYPSFSELVQFRNQYTIAKNLNLPGIIETYSLETYHNSYALVMEDFGGIALKEWMETGKSAPTLSEFLQVAIDLSNTLDILYRHRIIHKDIKPANILINPQTKQVKLIDFSIASLLPRETQTLMNPNVLEGTLGYLSPEQTGRMNRGIDYRTDFYSLGVTFYELLAGELPFQSHDPMELVHCHIAKQPPLIHEINPEIPSVLSEIVTKLMAKNAEHRYQSALGLKFDLELCLRQLEENGKIEGFAIASRDACDRFIIPEKLYGRESKVNTLLAAFDRVATPLSSPLTKGGQRGVEMMLVAGFSGIGKTAIVSEVHKPIVRQRGYFIKGKFDQFNRNIPFSAFVQAFRELMGQLLSESDEQLQKWQSQILQALGDNGQVIIQVIPELEKIIGQQPPATELSGTAAQNRFNLLFQNFLQVFTAKEHPLVIFLDDLQWADSASLQLMQLLMAESKTSYLLVIGAYRDNEVFAAHPLMLTVDAVVKAGATVNTITLEPLSPESLNYLVADTLNCVPDLARPLTDLVAQKTQGNPFFATQFLKALHQDGLIEFDRAAGHWQCDIVQVRSAALTDDVVEFMALQLQKLPEITQNILKLAACVGNQFDLNTLAIVSEQSQTEVATSLWKALQSGLILPQSEIYKFYVGQSIHDPEQESQTVNYKFLHDRVQQAAYTLIPSDRRQNYHLKIAKSFLSNLSPNEVIDRVLEIVRHFNVSIPLIIEPNWKDQVVQLNLVAGNKAIRSTAYSVAVDYLSMGIQLLAEDSWTQKRELTFKLYNSLAEASFLSGNFEITIETISVVKQKSCNILEKIKAHEVEIMLFQAQHNQLQSLNVALSVLHQLCVEIPEYPTPEDVQREIESVDTVMGTQSIFEIGNLPHANNPEIEAAMKILASIVAPTYQVRPLLFQFTAIRQFNLSIQYGIMPETPLACTLYGMVIVGNLTDVDRGYQLGKLGVDLLKRSGTESVRTITKHLFNNHIRCYKDLARLSLEPARLNGLMGMEHGDLEYAGYSLSASFATGYFAGVELESLSDDLNSYSKLLERVKQNIPLKLSRLIQQVIANLQSDSKSTLISGIFYDENIDLPQLYEKKDEGTIAFILVYKLSLACIFGDFCKGLEWVEEAGKIIHSLAGQLVVPTFYFYRCLVELYGVKIIGKTENNLHNIRLEQFQHSLYTLKQFALYCPANCQHKVDLLEAESHSFLGNRLQAIELYDRAIFLAKENSYIQEEALANELAAKFYLEWGKEKVAAGYMQEAYYCYAKWGATAKINDLEKRYPHLLQPILQTAAQTLNPLETLATLASSHNSIHSPTSSSRSSSSSINTALDFVVIIKASQDLASTIQLDELLYQLTQIILQNSGGDFCALIMPNIQEAWQVRAIARPEHTELCSELLENNSQVPVKLIQYVKNTQELVFIDRMKTDLPVIGDYLNQQKPQSILCLPILDRGQLRGILYLENRVTSGVFTSDRILILNFLCTQAAISLENARLYQQSQIKSQELEKSIQCLKQTQKQVQEAQEFLQLVIDNIPQTIFWKDTQSNYLGCNHLFARVAGLNSCQDIVGKTDYDLPWKKEESDWYRECDRRVMTSDISELGIIETQQQSGGNQTWLETNKIPLHDLDGKVIGILGTYADITNRKQLEQEKLRLITILESTSDLVGIADENGNNLYLNQAGQNLLQIPAEETNRFHIYEITAPRCLEILQTEALPAAIREGIWSGESVLLSRNGREIPISQVIVAHKDERGQVEYFSTIMRDISDRKRAETLIHQKSQELEQALKDLQQSQLLIVQSEKMSALGNLVAGVAHEINNPLGCIIGNVNALQSSIIELFGLIDLYKEKFPQPGAEIEEELETIDLDYLREDLPKLIRAMQDGGSRIKSISASLRTFSRADSDTKQKFNLHEGIDSTILILRHRLKANERRPAIEVVIDYGDIPEIACFPGQLNQVFMNLLANAIDALDESSQGRSFTQIEANPNYIAVRSSLEGDRHIKITIADNGAGMIEAVKQRIFDHLFTTKEVGKGTGLGLAIARQIIVEKHGGDLKVNSTPGRGTEFIVTLPIFAR